MMSETNVLVIVEGNKSENNFCRSIADAFHLNMSVYCLGTNIYSLYKKLEKYDFNADIKNVLAEIHPEYAETLKKKFAYTYLLFDFDPHHTKKEETRSLKDVVKDNIFKIQEMVSYFIDETDPSIGKLYINYPMLESFRDCNAPFDPGYRDEYVKLEDIVNFKQYVATKKMVRKHLDKYTDGDFSQLICMNVYKLCSICKDEWKAFTYEEYMLFSEGAKILHLQKGLINSTGKIAVLNTSLFFLLDYFGNQKGFYDSVNQCVMNDESAILV